jgi:non-heme chloroperoxidase
MLQTSSNPGGLPISAFDAIRAGVGSSRSQYYRDLAIPFHGANRPGAQVPQGLLDQFWLQSMQAGLKPALDCIRAFSETDFTEDLKKIDIPLLLIHGDDDQIVPIGAAARRTVELVRGARLEVYRGASHAIPLVHGARFNADVLSFIKG